MFLETEKDRSVVEEVFEINEKELFHRKDDNLLLHNLNYFESNLMSNSKKDFNIIYSIATKSLKKDELFLMNGFKTIVNSELSELVYDYFSNYFTTIYHADNIVMHPVFDSKSLVDKYINEAASEFGINSNKLAYVKSKKADLPPVLCSIMPNNKIVPSELFESYGTVRFVNIFPILVKVLKKGATLVIDEFDSSIHPSAIMEIINIFHNDEININHAQLIFNTHNPLYLNNNLFRRDEIKFIDRDDETKCSRHYSLSDFGTKGTNARKGKDYMNNYFMDEYGAIRNINFSDLFKKIVEE